MLLIGFIGATPTAIQTDDTWTNLSVSGAFAPGTASILLGGATGAVRKSTTAGFSFGTSAVTLRSAAATPAWVLFDKDYATNKQAYILNLGVNGAFNVSTDSMTYFNQWSLVNETIASIVDFVVASNGDMFFITGTNTIWRQMTSASTPWERVAATGVTGNILRLSASYETDKAIAYAQTGTTTAIQMSTNSANEFKAMSSTPGSIVAPANTVESLYVRAAGYVVVGSTGGIITTNTSAYWWVENTVGTGTFLDIKAASNGDLLAVSRNGAAVIVAKSSDNGVTWASLKVVGSTTTVASIATASARALVAPANDYATTGNIFVAIDGGVYRYPVATTVSANSFVAVDASVGTATGLVTAAGVGNSVEGNGMVYAADGGAVLDVMRVRGTQVVSELLGPAPTTLPVSAFGVLVAGSTTSGNVKLYAVATNEIWTYTDTLGVTGTGVAVSNLATTEATFFGLFPATSSCTVTWTALPNATDYTIKVNQVKQTNLYVAAPAATAATVTYAGLGATSAKITGMDPGTTYYISIWVARDTTGPVSSFVFSGNTTINTPLAVPTEASNLDPESGAKNVPTNPTFDWAAVSGATGYTLQVSTSADFATLVGSEVKTANTVYAWTSPALSNGTDYYWRVRADITGGRVPALG